MGMFIVFNLDNREIVRLTSSDYSAIDICNNEVHELISVRYSELNDFIIESDYCLKIREDITDEEIANRSMVAR